VTTTRLTAIAAAIAAAQVGTFAADDPLDEAAILRARAHAAAAGRFDRVWCAPDPRAHATATAMALGTGAPDAHRALRSCDFGAWAGRTPADVQATEPDAFARWANDVDARPPGGESMADVLSRVSGWLEVAGRELDGSPTDERIALVASALVVRAVIVAAIGAGPSSLAHVDIAPLGSARLNRHNGRWRLRALGAPTA
jgi:broad specificity phosphatase PhoE